MKKTAVIKLIIYSFTALLLTAILTVGILFDYGVFRYMTSGIIKYEEKEESGFSPADSDTMTFTNIDSISVEWTAGEVIIQKGDGNTVTVSENAGFEMNDSQKMRFSQNGNKLKIKFCKPILRWGSGTYNVWSKELTVTLPEKLYDSVSVETVSASVDIYDLKAKELDIETVSGDITLSGVDVSSLDCESVSGDFDAEDVSAADAAYETVSGSMNFNGTISKVGSFDSVSGNMNLRLPPDKYYALDMNTFSGKTTVSGNNNVNNDDNRPGAVNISMDSFSGNITFSSNIVSVYNTDEIVSAYHSDKEDLSSLPENLQQAVSVLFGE